MRENNCILVGKWKIYLRAKEEKIDIRGLRSNDERGNESVDLMLKYVWLFVLNLRSESRKVNKLSTGTQERRAQKAQRVTSRSV